MVRSPQFEPGMVSRVSKSLLWWKIAPETCGQEWMTDCICLRTGASAAFPNGITSPLDWHLDWPKIATEISGRCAQARHSLCVSVIFRCRKSSLERKFQQAVSRQARREEYGLALATGNSGCFATVLCRSFL